MAVENQEKTSPRESSQAKSILAWIVTLIICAALISVLFWQPQIARSMTGQTSKAVLAEGGESDPAVETALQNVPAFQVEPTQAALIRQPNPYTDIDTSLRTTAMEYTVQEGDSVFGIAEKFDIAPETVLWSNYDVLRDNPHDLAIGQVLKSHQQMAFGTSGLRKTL